MDKRVNKKQGPGARHRALNKTKGTLAFQGSKNRDDDVQVPVIKIIKLDHGPVPILIVDVNKLTEEYINRVKQAMQQSANESSPLSAEKDLLVPITKIPQDNDPVPILIVDVNKLAEEFINRVNKGFKQQSVD